MTTTRLLLIITVAACAWAAWPRKPFTIDTHSVTRQFVIHSTIGRMTDPIVVLGDSIVEASTLPRTLCNHPLINAGIGGMSTASALATNIASVLAARRAALIVVSLGINDAAIPSAVAKFRADYIALLESLRPLAQRIAITGISPPEPELPEGKKITSKQIAAYNSVLPEIATRAGVGLIEIPNMPSPHTFDGIHLNREGYSVWESAVGNGITRILCPD